MEDIEAKEAKKIRSKSEIELTSLIRADNTLEEHELEESQGYLSTSSSDDSNNVNLACSSGTDHGHSLSPGTANSKQVAANIFISFVGSGMLGMPYAFSQSGWFLGPLALSAASTASVYAMLLLVSTRKKLENDYGYDDIVGYGDVGRVVSGCWGESLVNACLVLSQVGFSTAYLIFVAANLYNVANIDRALTCLLCVPMLAVLVQFQDMKKLSPFSLFADVSNVVGLSSVLFEDYEHYQFRAGGDLTAINLSQLLYVTGIAVYSLEGVGMVLPLESSYVDRDDFPSLLKKCIFGITVLMIVFGCSGYYAFGSETETPITLNLEGEWATVVKLCLCIALYLTFPVMMFPVNEVMEDFFLSDKMPKPNRIFRIVVVIFSAVTAYSVPNFGSFLTLVGSSTCTILGFILPGYFHLMAFDRKELSYSEIFLDWFLILFGLMFGIVGTYNSIMDILAEDEEIKDNGRFLGMTLNSILTS